MPTANRQVINKSMDDKKQKKPDEKVGSELVDFLIIRDKKTGQDIIKTRGQ